MEYIEIVGARENNLKNVTLTLPKRKITIFTGVSGSGKSSIVFETIAQEAGRQLNETYSNFIRGFLPKYSRPDVDSITNLSTAIVIDQKRLGGNSRSTLGTITDINSLLRLLFSRMAQPHLGSANHYSFNDPHGMCQNCEGIGKIMALNLDTVLDYEKSLNEGAILLPGFGVGTYLWKSYSTTGFFDLDKKLKDYTPDEFYKLVHAAPEKRVVSFMDGDMNTTYEGLAARFERQNIKTEREKSEANQKKMEQFTKVQTCSTCHGARYAAEVLDSKLLGYSIYELTEMQLSDLIAVLSQLQDAVSAPIVSNIIQRLQGLIDIGLGYLCLTRESSTLSGGESQRVKMVKHLSSSLTDVLYIFDEPSIGLHPRDVHRLNELLTKLRDKGNTVLVVEHDPDVIKIADYVVDVGPNAGAKGGHIVFAGTYQALTTADTLTGRFLGRVTPINAKPLAPTTFFSSPPSSLHNLKNADLRIPQGLYTAVTGVAGSGKSTLVNEVFFAAYPQSIRIDQSAVSTNLRSNPATFSGIMDTIRQIFGTKNTVSPGLFSYNSEGGCENCGGVGYVETNLSFMDVVRTECEECGGTRFKSEVLAYRLGGKNIVDVMAMTVAEASDFFEHKDVSSKLKSIMDVGLHYMTLGQPLNTLSGGECQRLKLARELNKKGNIYILDEPTTGLHMSDIDYILDIIQRLVKKGNTVIVIEHNLDMIRNADWVVDLGPDGGSGGGEVLYEGPPLPLKDCARSITGRFI